MRKEAPMTGNVALWTNGRITIPLAQVTSCVWCAEADDDDLDQDQDIVSMEEATSFEIACGADQISIRDTPSDDFRTEGVSFLRALSLYWETRS